MQNKIMKKIGYALTGKFSKETEPMQTEKELPIENQTTKENVVTKEKTKTSKAGGLSDTDIESVLKLIERLENTPVLSMEEGNALEKKWKDAKWAEWKKTGEYKPSGLAVLSGDQESILERIKRINQDIQAQIDVVNEGLDLWFEKGELVPPHYANRIIILLSKNKRKDLETRFLRIYLKHFYYKGLCNTKNKMGIRADKLGINRDEYDLSKQMIKN